MPSRFLAPARAVFHAADTSGLSRCLGTAETKFTTAYGKATAAGGCIDTTDAATVEGKVDTFVNGVSGALAP